MKEESKERVQKFLFILLIALIILFTVLSIYSSHKKHSIKKIYFYRDGKVCPKDYFSTTKLYENLSLGDIDNINKTQVTQLQNFLGALGFKLDDYSIEGIYGLATKEAIAKFQYLNKKDVTGIIDNKTMKLINSKCHEPLKLKDD